MARVIIFLISMILVFFYIFKRRPRYSSNVTARVVDVRRVMKQTDTYTSRYRVIVEYAYNGDILRSELDKDFFQDVTKKNLPIGTRVTVEINPKNPQEIHYVSKC